METTQALVKTETEAPALPANLDASSLIRCVGMGDVSALSPEQRLSYIGAICKTVGLNGLTMPIRIMDLDGRMTLYATAECGAQLREKHGVSITIKDRREEHGVFIVVASATKGNKTDEAVGAVPVIYPEKRYDKYKRQWEAHPRAGQHFDGLDYANAIMKAETKAKRRVALSICGLGLPDESEVGEMKQAKAHGQPADVITDTETASDRAAALNAAIGQPIEAEVIDPKQPASSVTSAESGQPSTQSASPAASSSAPAAEPEKPQTSSATPAAAPAPQAQPANPAASGELKGSDGLLTAEVQTKLAEAIEKGNPSDCMKYLISRGKIVSGAPLGTLDATAANYILKRTEQFHKNVEAWVKTQPKA